MKRFLILTCALATGACATMPPQGVDGACRNDRLDRFVGHKADANIGAALLAASGAKTLRWGGPGMAMTMDFRPDRLTVSYDAAMVITSARCG
ncbi:I78 family peptidase inhibitor [Sphingobium sp.]|uniref:I78 family peptidase inhibitor n=1 Tax=Sphingobium sp. TaxID=1912891 RepID=UPI003BB73C9F